MIGWRAIGVGLLLGASAIAADEVPVFVPGCDLEGGVTREELRSGERLLASFFDETGGVHRSLGLVGLQGHRVGTRVRLLLALADPGGHRGDPVSPVVTIELSGERHGTVSLPGGPDCERLRFRPNALTQALALKLGTKADLTGVRPDESRAGELLPVWGAAETMTVTVGDSSFPQRLDLHPVAGAPVGLAWGPQAPRPVGFLQVVTRPVREERTARAVFPGLLEAVDAHGNGSPEPLAVSAVAASKAVSLRLEREVPERLEGTATTYRAVVEWRQDRLGRWPEGPVAATVRAGRTAPLPLLTIDFVSGRLFSLRHVPGHELGDDDVWTSSGGIRRDLSFLGPGEAKESPAGGLLRTPLLLEKWTDDGDASLVSSGADSFDVSLRDEAGEIAAGATIEVALCPRAVSCEAPIVSTVGSVEGARADEHGYLGLMVRKAPSRRGRYYWEVVPSAGNRRPWRLNGVRDIHGARLLHAVTVTGIAFLDDSLRGGPLRVDQPVRAYIHLIGRDAEEPRLPIHVWAETEEGTRPEPEILAVAERVAGTHEYLAAITVVDGLDRRAADLSPPVLRVGGSATRLLAELEKDRHTQVVFFTELLTEASRALLTGGALYDAASTLERESCRVGRALTSDEARAAVRESRDAWGRPLFLDRTSSGGFRLTSHGCDGRPDDKPSKPGFDAAADLTLEDGVPGAGLRAARGAARVFPGSDSSSFLEGEEAVAAARRTIEHLRRLGTVLETWRVDHGRFPSAGGWPELAESLRDYGGWPEMGVDAWGTPFRLEPFGEEGEHFKIVSAGADRIFETVEAAGVTDDPEDDLVLLDGEIARWYHPPRITVPVDLGPSLRRFREAAEAYRRLTPDAPSR